MGLASARAFANASSPQANQSTGLLACCRRYGLRSRASRFIPPLCHRRADGLVRWSIIARAGGGAAAAPAPADSPRHYVTGAQTGWCAGVQSRVMSDLAGKRVAMLVENEFEDLELTGPLEALRAAGATVTLVGPTAGAGFRGKKGDAIV